YSALGHGFKGCTRVQGTTRSRYSNREQFGAGAQLTLVRGRWYKCSSGDGDAGSLTEKEGTHLEKWTQCQRLTVIK
uniref:Uncharacterized protein n=1 Tax=Romanomermis culicivorax TaxID=13658 RepID=A0A915KT23_ROMCU